MTQHEYVFIAVSIILGLAITRLAKLCRRHLFVLMGVSPSTGQLHYGAPRSCCLYCSSGGWVGGCAAFQAGPSLIFSPWLSAQFFVYGAAELSLPTEDYDITDDSELNFMAHSQSLGRVSAASMLGYFCVGPHVNIILFGNPALPSIGVPLFGGLLMLLVILKTWLV